MSSTDTVDATAALARLLADPVLRARFLADRESTLASMGVAASQRAPLLAVDARGLQRQARALVAKRAGEVARLMPRTFARGGRELREVFEQHAGSCWPQGHRRHLLDAVAFAAGLAGRRHPALVRAEYNRLCFVLTRRRFAVYWCAGLQLLVGDPHGGTRELRLRLGL